MIGFILGTVALVALVRMVVRGRAQRWDGGIGYGGRFGLRNAPQVRALFTRLDTTPGQERVILEAIEEARTTVGSSRGELTTSRNDLVAAISADHFDPIVLEGTFARHDERITALRGTLMGALGKIHEALDPAQRVKLAEIIRDGFGRGAPRQPVPGPSATSSAAVNPVLFA